VNESVATFAAVGADVRFGMAAIRNVGVNVVEAVVAARRSQARHQLSDFLNKCRWWLQQACHRVADQGGRRSIRSGNDRKGMLLVHEQAVDAVIDLKRNEAIGQDSLFGGDVESAAASTCRCLPGSGNKTTRLNFEREMLGLYVSDTRVFGARAHHRQGESDISIPDLMDEEGSARPSAEAQIVRSAASCPG